MSRRQIVFCALVVTTFLLYAPVRNCSFVNYDDGPYASENPLVQAGLTWAGVKWAFSTFQVSNWHPLTWLSLMLDCQLFGANPAAHHFVNAVFHAVNAGLVFLLWSRLSGRFWASAAVAALFAWHPLRVESVAWIAERKDVISVFFGLLSLWAYTRYAEQRSEARQGLNLQMPAPEQRKKGGPRQKPAAASHVKRVATPSKRTNEYRRYYFVSLLLFGLGLLAKPMLVTLPFVFFVLDFWPLRRWTGLDASQTSHTQLRRLAVEKLPFLALSIASCIVTVVAQHATAMASLEQYPLHLRLANAALSYARYIWKTIFPVNLAVFYPVVTPGWWEVAVACGFLFALTALAWRMRGSAPWLLTGWLWYLGTLVPVIGVVQVGIQSMADRYTYLPAIGLLMAAVFLVSDIAAKLQLKTAVLAPATGLILGTCMILTARQIPVWKNGETLFTRAEQVTRNNPVAEYNLGMLLVEQGRLNEAIPHLRKTLAIGPRDAASRNALGIALTQVGQEDAGFACLAQALAIQPSYAPAHYNLAMLLIKSGRFDEALDHLNSALKFDPDLARAHVNAATILLQKGEIDSALRHLEKAVEIQPGYAEAQYKLGSVLLQKGQIDAAITHLQPAVELPQAGALDRTRTNASGGGWVSDGGIQSAPTALQSSDDLAAALLCLASAFAMKGQADEAIPRYEAALKIRQDLLDAHNGLGTLLAQKGRFIEASAHFQNAVRLWPKSAYARSMLGYTLVRTGHGAEAVPQYEAALMEKPGDPEIERILAWVLATAPEQAVRNGKRAVELAEHAASTGGSNSPAIATALAAAYAETGRFPEAVAAGKRALQWVVDHADADHIPSLQMQIANYEAGQPFRDLSLKNTSETDVTNTSSEGQRQR